MAQVLPTTFTYVDDADATVEATKAWVLNWDKVAQAKWFEVPSFMTVKQVFDARAIVPILIMFIVTAVETVGDISGITEGGLGREATDRKLLLFAMSANAFPAYGSKSIKAGMNRHLSKPLDINHFLKAVYSVMKG